MGIKNLTKFLTEKYPEVFDRGVKLSEYASQKIAIDTAIFMCKFKASNSDTWLQAFLSLVLWMRRENAHPVFILDTGMPPEKAAEKLKRAEARKKQETRIETLDAAVNAFTIAHGFEGMSAEHVELLKETYAKEEKRGGHNVSSRRRLLLLTPEASGLEASGPEASGPEADDKFSKWFYRIFDDSHSREFVNAFELVWLLEEIEPTTGEPLLYSFVRKEVIKRMSRSITPNDVLVKTYDNKIKRHLRDENGPKRGDAAFKNVFNPNAGFAEIKRTCTLFAREWRACTTNGTFRKSIVTINRW
jgi:hypothetical protein